VRQARADGFADVVRTCGITYNSRVPGTSLSRIRGGVGDERGAAAQIIGFSGKSA